MGMFGGPSGYEQKRAAGLYSPNTPGPLAAGGSGLGGAVGAAGRGFGANTQAAGIMYGDPASALGAQTAALSPGMGSLEEYIRAAQTFLQGGTGSPAAQNSGLPSAVFDTASLGSGGGAGGDGAGEGVI